MSLETFDERTTRELRLKGIRTLEEARNLPGWVVGHEVRQALLSGDHVPIVFEEHEPVGWDVHIGDPAPENWDHSTKAPHGAYMGVHADKDEDGNLGWRVCTERNTLRQAGQIEAHGGELLHHAFHLNPDRSIIQIRLVDAEGREVVVLEKVQQDSLFDPECRADFFGNRLDHNGDGSVTVTGSDGQWARMLLEGYAIAGLRTPAPPVPDREISVWVGGEVTVFPVPPDQEVTLGMILAGRTQGQVRVEWDGQTVTLSQRELWGRVVEGDAIVVRE